MNINQKICRFAYTLSLFFLLFSTVSCKNKGKGGEANTDKPRPISSYAGRYATEHNGKKAQMEIKENGSFKVSYNGKAYKGMVKDNEYKDSKKVNKNLYALYKGKAIDKKKQKTIMNMGFYIYNTKSDFEGRVKSMGGGPGGQGGQPGQGGQGGQPGQGAPRGQGANSPDTHANINYQSQGDSSEEFDQDGQGANGPGGQQGQQGQQGQPGANRPGGHQGDRVVQDGQRVVVQDGQRVVVQDGQRVVVQDGQRVVVGKGGPIGQEAPPIGQGGQPGANGSGEDNAPKELVRIAIPGENGQPEWIGFENRTPLDQESLMAKIASKYTQLVQQLKDTTSEFRYSPFLYPINEIFKLKISLLNSSNESLTKAIEFMSKNPMSEEFKNLKETDFLGSFKFEVKIGKKSETDFVHIPSSKIFKSSIISSPEFYDEDFGIIQIPVLIYNEEEGTTPLFMVYDYKKSEANDLKFDFIQPPVMHVSTEYHHQMQVINFEELPDFQDFPDMPDFQDIPNFEDFQDFEGSEDFPGFQDFS